MQKPKRSKAAHEKVIEFDGSGSKVRRPGGELIAELLEHAEQARHVGHEEGAQVEQLAADLGRLCGASARHTYHHSLKGTRNKGK